jgi:molybdopterin converting factor small subunit
MKGSIKILDASGHTTVTYDTETKDGVEEARAALSRSRFATLFDAVTKEKVDRTGVTGDTILEQHEELIVVPTMAGGR